VDRQQRSDCAHPLVHVAEQHERLEGSGSRAVALRGRHADACEELRHLDAPLACAEPEVRRDHPHHLGPFACAFARAAGPLRDLHADVERAARGATREGQIDALGADQRQAREQRVAVQRCEPPGCRAADPLHPDLARDPGERRVAVDAVDLLEGDHVGVELVEHAPSPRGVAATVAPDPVVDGVARHPKRTRRRSCGLCHATPARSASAATASRRRRARRAAAMPAR
jgi:hypothetical protein